MKIQINTIIVVCSTKQRANKIFIKQEHQSKFLIGIDTNDIWPRGKESCAIELINFF